MTHQEICDGKLVIIDPIASWNKNKTISDNKLNLIPRKLAYRAHLILEDLHDGTYISLKNRYGKVGETVTRKDITMFMLRYT